VEQHILEWLARYGTPVLFLAQLFGIFGVPIPDELLLTLAGALVRRGALGPGSTLGSAIAGCTAGITISYVLGRTVGLHALQKAMRIEDAAVQRAQWWFRRFGRWLLAFGYFIPGVRHITAIAAGSTTLEYSTFATFAYPGAVLWSSTFVGLGYFAGDRWRQLFAAARSNLLVVALLLLAAGVIWAVLTRPRPPIRS
jgi:membrane protein DedA with SNARE-associated domain